VLLREGHGLTAQLRTASRRAFGDTGERVGTQIIASIHGTVTGLVFVGLAEGAILGVAFAVAGVPHPVLMGTLSAIAAILPFGATVAAALAALLLAASGSVIAACVLLGFGSLLAFGTDHFVRPVLIGGSTKLPFLWVLLGILGGLEVWGLPADYPMVAPNYANHRSSLARFRGRPGTVRKARGSPPRHRHLNLWRSDVTPEGCVTRKAYRPDGNAPSSSPC
jgi:hypothetical protein